MAFAISRNRNNASITIADAHRFPEVGVPWFWPLAFAQAGLELALRHVGELLPLRGLVAGDAKVVQGRDTRP